MPLPLDPTSLFGKEVITCGHATKCSVTILQNIVWPQCELHADHATKCSVTILQNLQCYKIFRDHAKNAV